MAFAGLTNPTQLSFSPDGRVFVAEKSGLIQVFDNLADATPTVFADLRTNVHNFWDRGLLGMALHPQFPTQPYVYVLYTHDAAIGGTARDGAPPGTFDGCPTPPGSTGDGCVVAGGGGALASAAAARDDRHEQVLSGLVHITEHSMGTLVFGSDGALYVTARRGELQLRRLGQDGPAPPCADPPGGWL